MLVLAVVLALVLPPALGGNSPILASDIALASSQVKAALNGAAPVAIGVTDNFGSPSVSRVVMALPPEQAVIADVDMTRKTVTYISVQKASDVTEEQVHDIANTDPRVREALAKGYCVFYDRMAELYTEVPADFDFIEPYKSWGANPCDMVGFLAFLGLRYDPANFARSSFYTVIVNVSLGKVVFFAEPADLPVINITTSISITGIPPRTFVVPDPGSDSEPIRYPVKFIAHTPYHLVVAEIGEATNKIYKTWTWDVSEGDIEKILALANGSEEVEALLAKGARIVSLQPSFSFGGSNSPSSASVGISWRADVRIDLGEISYYVSVNLTRERVYARTQAG